MEFKVPRVAASTQRNDLNDDYLDFAGVATFLRKHLLPIALIAIPTFILGAAYAYLAPSVYQANLLIKVDVNDPSQRNNIPTNLTGIFDLKTAAAAEIEMLRSRAVVTRAVERARLYIDAKPKYFPLLGQWFARKSKDELSTPGLIGLPGYVWGSESIDVSRFDIPEAFEKMDFTVTVESLTTFSLRHRNDVDIHGPIGKEVGFSTPEGNFLIKIESIHALPGAQFVVRRLSMEDAVEELQKNLVISERGKESGLIFVGLESTNPALAARVLNEIGQQYIAQNLNLKTEEAEKSLTFLETQLPVLKLAIETAEAKFSSFRNSRGSTDLNEEVKAVLQQSVQSQVRLIELRQRQDELRTLYQDENPLVQAVTKQIKTISGEIASINEKIKRIPGTEQDLVKLTRDVRVNTELYASLLATAQQLRLVRASTVGSARLIDSAVRPSTPIGPKRLLILLGAAAIGLFLGLMWGFVRNAFTRFIDSPDDLSRIHTIPVSAVIPHSKLQSDLEKVISRRGSNITLLADQASEDGAVESLRTFRTTLEFAKESTRNNVIAITGATASIGKTFIASNLAALLASSGKRVLLIDADLRNGYLHRYLGMKRKLGLSELLAGQIQFSDAVHQNIVKNLDFISTGDSRARPADALANGILGSLINKNASTYDYVLVDTTPVLVGADALIVSSHAGMVFCVVRRGTSKAEHLTEAVNRFNQSGIPVDGFIFNDAKPSDLAYGYGYPHQVSQTESA